MKIVGLDMSVTHTGCVMMTLDDRLNIVDTDWLTFTTTKKYASERSIWYDKDCFTDKYDKYEFMQERILDFAKEVDMVAAEDYAYGKTGAVGLVFDLAEFEGWIRQSLWRMGKPLYLYSPMTIKKIFTGHGDSDKLSMWNTYKSLTLKKPDLSIFPPVTNGKKGTPGLSDVVDAYGAAESLRTELLIEQNDSDPSPFPKHIQEFWKNRTRSVLWKPRKERN